MKVIFVRDVPRVGKKNQVKQVPDGYAVNFLFPNKYAVAATPEAEKKLVQTLAAADTERKVQHDLLMKNLAGINAAKLTISSKANDKGHLFSGIHKEQIVSELKSQAHLDVSPDFIELDKPLKETGEHKITISSEGKSAVLTVEIVAA
jgi:large subunit ribosomal protein L9